MKALLIASVGLLALGASAAGLRRLPSVTVSEGASLEIGAETAVNLRSSNTALASVTPPDGGRATVSGVRLGNVEIVYSDVKGPIAVRPVTVVPNYWETLIKFFEDDPEISVSVSGDKVIVTGKTANPDTLRHVEKAKEFDSGRIVSHVTYSLAAIGSLVGEYLSHIGYSNVTATVIGHDVCLSGRLYDEKAIKRVEDRTKQFLSDFPGMTVNIDALKIVKQKIVLEVELLEFDTTMARNLGIKTPEQITIDGKFDYGWDFSRTLKDGRDGSRTDTLKDTLRDASAESYWEKTAAGEKPKYPWTRTDKSASSWTQDGVDKLTSARDSNNKLTLGSKVSVSDVNVTINMLKKNGASKTLYKTSLATQSGEQAEFQNGGTIHRNTQSTFSNGDLKEVEYGFIIKATPTILDANTVSLLLDLDNKTPLGYAPNSIDQPDITISRYQTKSRYMVRPGETIVMSGFDKGDESLTKSGTPFLSHLPFIGEWLFGSRSVSDAKTEKLLVVTVNWALEDESTDAVRRRDEFRNRKVEVGMP